MVSQSTIAAIRFGYGFSPDQAAPPDAGALLDELSLPDRDAGGPDTATRLGLLEEFRDAKGDRERQREIRLEMRRRAFDDIARHLEGRATAQHGFRERWAAFWLDHFTVSLKNIGQLYVLAGYEAESIRPHLGGRFGDMLKAVVRAPAMLRYLDQVASFGPNSRVGQRGGRGLNENLAREILELHTLGVGGPYGQTDVRELAELLTGFTFAPATGAFRFVPNRAEPGAETVLGRRYGGDPARESDVDAALEDLAVHPATARHLAGKIAVHFVADAPDPGLVDHLAATWTATGGDLARVAGALLEHPAAWRGPGAKVKRPQDLLISTLRAAGMRPAGDTMKRGRGYFRALRMMNQPVFQAPGPDGWEEAGEAWITPQGLASRLRFAGAAGRRLAEGPLDPRAFAEAALDDALTDTTRQVVAAAPERWEGFALVLASPEFNRR